MAGPSPQMGLRTGRDSSSLSDSTLVRPRKSVVVDTRGEQTQRVEVETQSRIQPRQVTTIPKRSVKASVTSTSISKRTASHSLDRPRKLGTTELMGKMAAGRWIDVLVGPGGQTYKLPAEILAHYSPFLDTAINGPLSGDSGDSILLPDICKEDFEIFVDLIIKGTLQESLTVEKWGNNIIERCVSFVVFAKKLHLGPVDDAIHGLLEDALKSNGSRGFRPHHIENIFASTSTGSNLRVLITKVALSVGTIHLGAYRKQEEEVHGFAAELLQQIRSADLSATWTDPLSGKKRKIDEVISRVDLLG